MYVSPRYVPIAAGACSAVSLGNSPTPAIQTAVTANPTAAASSNRERAVAASHHANGNATTPAAVSE